MKIKRALYILSFVFFSFQATNGLFSATKPKIYLSVFYNGRVGLVLDFTESNKGLMAIVSDEGKWDIKIKDPKNSKVEYYKRGTLKGKVKRVGSIYIKRYKRGHEEGQPSRIGSIIVRYYHQRSDAFYGKIMRIGDYTIKYHQYSTLASYNKIYTLRNIRNGKKTLITYYNSNKKGFPVAGKLRKVYSKQSRVKLTPVYNRSGFIKRTKGAAPFLKSQFFSKSQLEQIQSGLNSTQENQAEKALDRFLD